MKAPRCSRRGCGTPRTERPDRNGAIAWECEPCKRNAMGYCRDCPRILEDPNAWRCARCRRKQKSKRQSTSRRRRLNECPALAKREREKKRALRVDPIEGDRIRRRARERYAQKKTAGTLVRPDGLDRAYKRAWYAAAVQEDPGFLKRYSDARRERYRNDPEYREAKKAAAKESYRRRKAARPAALLAVPIAQDEVRRAS